MILKEIIYTIILFILFGISGVLGFSGMFAEKIQPAIVFKITCVVFFVAAFASIGFWIR